MLQNRTFARDWSFANLQALWFGQHLYQPLLHFKSDLVEVSPVSLNEGERDFVLDLRAFLRETGAFSEGANCTCSATRAGGRGIGFFEAGNFHPDFIVWLLDGTGKQYVIFVDPKGIHNLEGPNDPKIRFHRTIREIAARLADPNVVLNSFIVSNTPFWEVGWWEGGLTRAELENSHVVFQKDEPETYIGKMLSRVLGL